MSNQGRKGNTDRQTWADALKGIAICGVVMMHSGGGRMPSFLGKIGGIGQNGVQLFFLLSAYLAFVSFEHHICKNGNETKASVYWIIKRFLRLIPLYYLALFICGVFEGCAAYWLGTEGHISFFNVLAHMTFTHGFFPHYMGSIIGVEWYLGVLAVFYVLTPCFYQWIDSLEKSIIWFLTGGILCYGFSYFGYHYLVPDVADAYIYGNYFNGYSFIPQLPVLLLGIMMYHLFKSNMLEKIQKKKMFSKVLLFFSLCMIAGMALEQNRIFGLSGYTLFGLWFLLLAVSQQLSSCVLIDNPLFAAIGKHSYPIYLFHVFLLWLYDKYIPGLSNNLVVNWLIKFILIVIVSFVMAILLDTYYEAPILRKLNGIADERFKRK